MKTYRILHFASFFNESWMKSMALAVFVDPLLYSNALIVWPKIKCHFSFLKGKLLQPHPIRYASYLYSLHHA
jgi:hypothetical protein